MAIFVEHDRRSSRLPTYEYSLPGAYVVTVCTFERECLFGQIKNGEMQLNECGTIVTDEWIKTPTIRPYVGMDAFVVMPNHFHGIMWLYDEYHGRGTAARLD